MDRMTIGVRLTLAFGSLAVWVCALMAVALWGLAQPAGGAGAAVLWVWILGGAAVAVALLSLWSLRRGIVQPLSQAILIAETVASGDLSQEFSSELGGDFGRLLGALGTMEDTLTELVGRIKQSADAIGVSSGEIEAGNVDLSRRSRCPHSRRRQPAWSSSRPPCARTRTARARPAAWR
jgi:methyl-accepting chemotaxis protein